MSSVDAILSRYVPAHAPPDPRSPFAPPPAEPSPPAIFTRGARRRVAADLLPRGVGRVWGRGRRRARHRESGNARLLRRLGPGGGLGAGPGGKRAGRVPVGAREYPNRRYRCVLDGKVLSKFSIMRVHVARKFAGSCTSGPRTRSARPRGHLRAHTGEHPADTGRLAGNAGGGGGGGAGGAGRVFPRARVRGGVWRGRRRAPAHERLYEHAVSRAPDHAQTTKRVEELEEERRA